jgi:hypothetical protein
MVSLSLSLLSSPPSFCKKTHTQGSSLSVAKEKKKNRTRWKKKEKQVQWPATISHTTVSSLSLLEGSDFHHGTYILDVALFFSSSF